MRTSLGQRLATTTRAGRLAAGCLTVLLLTGTAGAQAPAQAPAAGERVVLSPHRAVYDLRLDTSKPSKTIDLARGRIAFDFTGDACEGYSLNFRQVVELNATETGTRRIDVRSSNFEDGDGKLFRFKTQSDIAGAMQERGDGVAEAEGDGYKVRITQPKAGTFAFARGVLFPSEHLKQVIRAARRGDTTFAVKVYDGSDEGQQIYETLSIIGRRIAPGQGEGLEPAAKAQGLMSQARWPVTVSYFKPGQGEVTPSYAISFELYENGVTRALKLDYRDFRLIGDLVTLDLSADGPCAK